MTFLAYAHRLGVPCQMSDARLAPTGADAPSSGSDIQSEQHVTQNTPPQWRQWCCGSDRQRIPISRTRRRGDLCPLQAPAHAWHACERTDLAEEEGEFGLAARTDGRILVCLPLWPLAKLRHDAARRYAHVTRGRGEVAGRRAPSRWLRERTLCACLRAKMMKSRSLPMSPSQQCRLQGLSTSDG